MLPIDKDSNMKTMASGFLLALVGLPAVFLLLWPGPSDAADRKGAETYRTVCAACHGAHADGNKDMAAPPLTGQSSIYLFRQLIHFRDDVRYRGSDAAAPAATMRDVAKGIGDDATLRAVADYLGSLKAKAGAAPSVPAQAAAGPLGRSLNGICVGCHGGTGEGNADLEAPRIAGLPVWYIEAQLRAFKSGQRGGHPDDKQGRQMTAIVESLPGDEAIQAVAAYVAGLPAVGRKTP